MKNIKINNSTAFLTLLIISVLLAEINILRTAFIFLAIVFSFSFYVCLFRESIFIFDKKL
jgi:hypothetical protein